MKRFFLVGVLLLLLTPAITGVRLVENKLHSISYVYSGQDNKLVPTGNHNQSGEQLQKAVPHKTPRRLSSLRRRFINTTVDVYTATNFCLSHFGWGWNQWHLAKRHTVFNFLGGEAAFLFRLTPF
jgi:hypothetical protein